MVDTNILVYATINEAPKCDEARRWMQRLQKDGVQLCATPQIYREYLVVLTRGSVFERRFSSDEALATLNDTRPAFRTLSPTGDTFEKCTLLLQRYGVRGKQVHDANIVAVMMTYGLKGLATYNQSDFRRFDDVFLLDP
ncbi:type II toxin-antitoxin system VapC family toxin [Salinibacter ruber]|uniref:type II toxin-antitoxin system VapC family toxin n=1 Tax=Salinibacter ruber TaxID=146919 RepID=UPI002168C283|nr:type II toxin-antitoxin system VapC family toxin [Salinibacter ruber]MCS4174766.1 putative nucleic acid-binding protein [Salinibacter ruber]